MTDAPMIPFLYSDLEILLRNLMERFVKADVLKPLKNIHKIDVTDEKNLCEYTKVDVGFSAQKIL